jgi:Na+/H+-dicarboxylate symporter
MNRDSEFLHLFVAVLMMAPIFVFYVFIAAELFGYRPVERLSTLSPLVLAQVCTAFAKGTLPVS